jgi:guanylate kinase
MSNRRGTIIVLSSPSGGGKTTLAARVLAKTDGLVRSVSMTTRPPRSGEKSGDDYFFVSREEFERIKREGGFLEHATVFGHQYGTPHRFVEAELKKGKDVLLVIDVQGAMAVKEKCPDAELVFVNPPPLAELEKRLRERKTDSEEAIRVRLETARRELEQKNRYNHIVSNAGDIEAAVAETMGIIRTIRQKRKP